MADTKAIWRSRVAAWRASGETAEVEEVAVEPEGPSIPGPADGDGSAADLAAVQPVADTPAGTVADAASPTIADATALPVSKLPMSKIVTAPMPPMLFQRSLATPSLVAHIASDKWCDGLPLHRQEDRFKPRPPDQNLRCLDDDADPAGCTEVGCWSHARRPIWETAGAPELPFRVVGVQAEEMHRRADRRGE